jgi:CpcD/allophycocyanin linker domain
MGMMTGDRPVVIEVGGVCQGMTHQSNYRIKVPYSNLSNAMQSVTRRGGKILNVTIGHSAIDREEQPSDPVSVVTSEPQLTSSAEVGNADLQRVTTTQSPQSAQNSQNPQAAQKAKNAQKSSGKGFQIKKK